MELREMTSRDYDCYAGAEPMSDGSNPLIGEGYCCTIIVDGSGIEMDYTDEDGNLEGSYYLELKNSALGKFIAESLPTETPESFLLKLGFVKIV